MSVKVAKGVANMAGRHKLLGLLLVEAFVLFKFLLFPHQIIQPAARVEDHLHFVPFWLSS